ncbi:hypothetical protein [Jeotgalibaca porci]|uniref:hypothetical protein n=1 Tax=Jeotgalibaca porci TaxID=1868793 RepID=UPI00359FD878
MIVIDKTPGKKIPYEIIKNSIFFNDEIMFNLEKYERDFEQNIDICEDENFSLANGLGRRYVAQIVIPARRYEAAEVESEEEPTSEAVPFDISECTLILWGLE